MKLGMNGKFYFIISKVTDLVILNVLYLLFCIPVVTIGAATTALYYVALKMTKNTESYIFRSFKKSFLENFRQATVIWLIFLCLGAFLALDYRIVLTNPTPALQALAYVLGLIAVLASFLFLYTFPVLSRFDNPIGITLQNALLMALRHLPYTLVMLFISVVPLAALFLFSPLMLLRLFPVYLLFGFALPAFLNSFFFEKIFEKYMPEEAEE